MHSRFGITLTSFFLLTFNAHGTTIANGGFETGDLSGWTLTNGTAFDVVCATGAPAGSSTCITASGAYSMSFGHFEGVTTLSQSVATTSGSSYQVTFQLANFNPAVDPTETFAVLWNGVTVYSLSNPQGSFPFTLVTLNLTAAASSSVLAFEARHDPEEWFLDDVSIADATEVPEPGPFALTGIGLMMAVMAARASAPTRDK
jgi:hypothetical protein